MYIHISARPPVLNHQNQDNALNGSFPIKERSDLGPQSFLQTLRSTNIAASANIRKLQPTPTIYIQRSKNEIPIIHHTLSIIHPSVTIRAKPNPIHQHTTHMHPSKTTQQPQHQCSNTVVPSLPYPLSSESPRQTKQVQALQPYTTDMAKTSGASWFSSRVPTHLEGRSIDDTVAMTASTTMASTLREKPVT